MCIYGHSYLGIFNLLGEMFYVEEIFVGDDVIGSSCCG